VQVEPALLLIIHTSVSVTLKSAVSVTGGGVAAEVLVGAITTLGMLNSTAWICFCNSAICDSNGESFGASEIKSFFCTVSWSTVANGGPSSSSLIETGLVPDPVKTNKFKKNRYHSRDNNPVVGSVNGVRGAGMLVILRGLGTGRT
jgi:hypothetical protein